jgi:tetratricopeptide (TPR) repeat protein
MQWLLAGLVGAMIVAGASSAQITEDSELCASEDDSLTLDEQIAICTRVIEAGNASTMARADAYYNRAIAEEDNERPDLALADYGEAIRLVPDYTDAYFNRAGLYYAAERYPEAISDMNQVIRLDPGDTDAYYNRGLTYYATGDDRRAVADYVQAIALDEEDADARAELAWILATSSEDALRDGAEAVRQARRALELEDNALNHDALAAALAETGQFEQAATEESIAIGLTGDDEALAEEMRQRLDLYRQGKPYRD